MFNTKSHIMRNVIKKCEKYIPWAIFMGLDDANVDCRYTNLIKDIYSKATMQINIEEYIKSDKILLKRGV